MTEVLFARVDDVDASAALAATAAAEAAQAAAESAAVSAANTLDDFEELWLGVFADAPTADGDGDPLQIGAMYFNSGLLQLNIYDGANWNPVANGTDGTNAYVYIAYAAADDGTGFTNTFDPDLNYIAIIGTDTELLTPVASDFAGKWKNYKGEKGDLGDPGLDGAVWYTGATDPSDLTGDNGDFYLQTGTGVTGVLGDIWTKGAGTWSITGNIRGPAGTGDMSNLVDDTTPQLGGNLDPNGFTVGDATAADLTKLHALAATATELNYVDGVTSAIQGQIDGKQAASANLTTFAGIAPSANVQSILSAADYAAVRTLLSLTVGTNVQAFSANLTTWSGIAPSANAQAMAGAADYAAMRALLDLEIGTDVQAYDADLTTWAGKTAPSGTVVGTSDSQILTSKTLTDPTIVGTIKEDIFVVTTGAGFAIDPRNGSVQRITLTASRTPVASNFNDGDSVTLFIADGSAFTITWTTVGVVWKGGTAPTLATTGYTEVNLTKENGVIRGVVIGDFAS